MGSEDSKRPDAQGGQTKQRNQSQSMQRMLDEFTEVHVEFAEVRGELDALREQLRLIHQIVQAQRAEIFSVVKMRSVSVYPASTVKGIPPGNHTLAFEDLYGESDQTQNNLEDETSDGLGEEGEDQEEYEFSEDDEAMMAQESSPRRVSTSLLAQDEGPKAMMLPDHPETGTHTHRNARRLKDVR
jgi:hypothetical protein